MRHTLLATFCLLAAPLIALESTNAAEQAGADRETQATYLVQLTEFQVKSSSDPKMSARDIVARFQRLKDDKTAQPIEVIRLSVLGETETMIQFGRQTEVTSGIVSSGRGSTTRQTDTLQIGTLVRLTVSPRADQKALVTLSYESSRLEGEGEKDLRPDIVTTQIEGAHIIELGKSKLIAGTSAGRTSFLILSVEDSP